MSAHKASVYLLLIAAGLIACGDDDDEIEVPQITSPVELFVKLPADVRFPEGLTVDPNTESVYVATYDFFNEGPRFTNKVIRYSRAGELEAVLEFGGAPLLGIQYNENDQQIYICNVGASKIQRVPADFTDTTPIEDVADVPQIGAPGDRIISNPDGTQDITSFGQNGTVFPQPNVPVFDSVGNLYFSDSFQGAVFRVNTSTCTAPCDADLVKQDPFLATAGFPAFGANGLAFNDDESELYICNTGDDRILSLNTADNSLQILTESIDGCDGFVRDPLGRLWVAANQADQMYRLDAQGQVVERLGTFEGIDSSDNSPIGLLFPTNAAFLGNDMFVANLSQFYTPSEGDEVEELITTYHISRISLDL